MQTYLWKGPSAYPKKLVGMYDHKLSPWHLSYTDGKVLSPDFLKTSPIINFTVNRERLQRIDCLEHSGTGPLVNQKIIDLLLNIAPNDFQLVKPKINCLDGELEGYYILNVTHTVNGIDHERSVCDWGHVEHYVRGFKKLFVLPNCLGKHHLALEEEAHSQFYASQVVVDTFKKHHIKGVQFWLPEEYFPVI